jgi:hypothetical protein
MATATHSTPATDSNVNGATADSGLRAAQALSNKTIATEVGTHRKRKRKQHMFIAFPLFLDRYKFIRNKSQRSNQGQSQLILFALP